MQRSSEEGPFAGFDCNNFISELSEGEEESATASKPAIVHMFCNLQQLTAALFLFMPLNY